MNHDGDTASSAVVAATGTGEADVDSTWIRAGPGDGSLSRVDAVKDEIVRRWDVVTPSATMIGRAASPEQDLSDNIRRLHDEQHPAMAGHGARMHQLDKLRITHALASSLDVTRWERDCALGIMGEIDLTAFGSQRGIPKVALVVLRYVVDRERQHQLGLDDQEWVASHTPDEMESLYERFTSLTESETYQELLDEHDLTTTNINRLTRVLRDQLTEHDLEGMVLGRSPYRDPNLPPVGETPRDEDSERHAWTDGWGTEAPDDADESTPK
ncbi:DNA-directed RNA polymerase subunit epsilon [Haloarchaeobius sp. HME9146]|uniref:DNA-directed RNA polymerase subunit epsilon n=1 Tax=Haloarchaeobius sp. HME9146 TaxID=2978732 RepID=UPI0021C04DC9|nr:DNA-directed RNA polymerase subunit epsilon [Haloarchaeobius sp. HME9146]MCT9098511.1 DNA-directed RNA polymerase subunit epsilon [Haloarchaeobius sp. HME9146]